MNKFITLRQTIRPGIIQPVHECLINEIDKNDFGSVATKTAEDLSRFGKIITADYLDQGILALKQYYAVAILDPLNMHAVSPLVDDFWHSHLLFTKSYSDFCHNTAGYFMHHEPLDHDNQPEATNVQRVYQYNMACFEHFFWHVDSQFWPQTLTSAEVICTHFGDTIEMCQQRTTLLPRRPDMQPDAVFVRIM